MKSLIKVLKQAWHKTRVIRRHFHAQWFSKYWWQYLLEKPKDSEWCNWWERFWCRASLHPDGVWWYSSGSCPDMRCKRCGDDLG